MRKWSVSATVVLVAVSACGDRTEKPTSNAAEHAGGVVVYCAVNTADILNPFVSGEQAANDLRPILFTPLVLYDSAGGFRPALARSWTWSDDKRSLSLNLRTDVRWHDGQPVTAQDVLWTIKAAIDSAYPYWARGELADVEGVEPADQGVRISFKRPFVPGIEPFARLPILPRHILDTVSASAFRTSPYNQQPVGNGPFRAAGKLPDGSLKLDRVPDYPEELGRAHLDRLVIREVPEASAILVELNTGAVDICTVGSSIAGDAANSGNTVIPVTPVGSMIIALDVRKPPFTDVRVRRALSAALQRTEIAGAVSRAATPARDFLPDAAIRWRDTTILQPDDDLTLAQALLDSAGWQAGAADGVRRNAAGDRLRFTITGPAPFQNVLTVVQAQLRRAGVDAQLRLMEPSAYFGLLGQPSRRPDAMAVIFTPDRIAVPDAFGLFHSNGDMNLASYSNARADSILERLQTPISDDARARLYHALQRELAADVPVIYAVNAPRMLAIRPRLHDVRADANGPFANVAQWWVDGSARGR